MAILFVALCKTTNIQLVHTTLFWKINDVRHKEILTSTHSFSILKWICMLHEKHSSEIQPLQTKTPLYLEKSRTLDSKQWNHQRLDNLRKAFYQMIILHMKTTTWSTMEEMQPTVISTMTNLRRQFWNLFLVLKIKS